MLKYDGELSLSQHTAVLFRMQCCSGEASGVPEVGGQLRVLRELAGSGNLELPRCRSPTLLLNMPHLQAV